MKYILIILLLTALQSCKQQETKQEFDVVNQSQSSYWKKIKDLPEFNVKIHSDGCSGGMSKMYLKMTFLHKKNGKQLQWRGCCETHDKAYYYGGTKKDKQQADTLLSQCVTGVVGKKYLGAAMQLAVKIGGSPHLPTSYRWGYGEDFRE